MVIVFCTIMLIWVGGMAHILLGISWRHDGDEQLKLDL